ncbi:hypothetical protein EDC56_2795 [Sinobacterium caligoides]|uniref:Amidohydrolase 3 domain-containing protein n=1 Tax=Sinobacterium caligoides TaxID=933926 RepID=A0A3N2DKF1_9GAMM|nr:amidohydrolase [Sinobacterium caligoides]ROS00159.1 hypothetical protein EDC56_2795 [Sinobacterium caligoides]
MGLFKAVSAVFLATSLSSTVMALGSPLVGWGKAADTIYYGGDIVTMNEDQPTVQAVAVRAGKILDLGSGEEMLKHGRLYTRLVNLQGKTLLPGFIDAHGHVSMLGMQSETAPVLPAPDGSVNSIQALQDTLTEWVATEPEFLEKTGWIVGFGYDDSQLAERRHPVADELDEVSTELPVAIIHQSGHLASLNHRALEMVGYTKGVADPEGGVIRREADGVTPNGVLEEEAAESILTTLMGSTTDIAYLSGMVTKGAETFAENGFTTAQDGKTPVQLALLMSLSTLVTDLPIDITSYVDATQAAPLLTPKAHDTNYFRGFRIAGHKSSIDGSPQGKTAWLTEPYFVPPEGKDASYRGYPAITRAELDAATDAAYKNDLQLLVHANGDAAIDWMIDSFRLAEKKYGKKDLRPVLIHGQTLREDQIPALKELGIIPSLFTLHTFYWGDWHYESVLGPDRANYISPSRDVLDAGLKLTVHADSPVVLPSALRMIWSTVNRQTRSGRILGDDQRITPYEALQAITINAAYQYFEEDKKGSLEVGKLADLVVLSDNPLTVDPITIADIEVLETIKENKNVFSTGVLTSETVFELVTQKRDGIVAQEIINN